MDERATLSQCRNGDARAISAGGVPDLRLNDHPCLPPRPGPLLEALARCRVRNALSMAEVYGIESCEGEPSAYVTDAHGSVSEIANLATC